MASLRQINAWLTGYPAIRDSRLYDSIHDYVDDERTSQNGGGEDVKGKCVDPMLRPHSRREMTGDFELSSKDLKHYPHFDAPLPLHEARRLVSNKKRVSENKFYPLLLYYEEWQPYRTADIVKPERKVRPIRYGARRDSYIFKHYREILSEKYENKLGDLGISDCPIAYRRISKGGGAGGKCNIDFAKEAFDEIDRIGNCVAVALDIEGYFESLDHYKIKDIWSELLGVDWLPSDHYAVFKNITKYHYVDQREVYRRLGYLGEVERGGVKFEGFTVERSEIPKQLCSPRVFRDKICGEDPDFPNIIQKNDSDFGIPQGVPISDLIANFYLMYFDVAMNDFAVEKGGMYMRYSDDILVILPGGCDMAEKAIGFAESEISKSGSKLVIKSQKTCAVGFTRVNGDLGFHDLIGDQGKNGFEYLGFRYDGRKVYIKDATMSRLYRKVSIAAKREGGKYIAKNPDFNENDAIDSFNYSLFAQRFFRVKKEYLSDDYRSWTFYSYLKRAAYTFGAKGDRIPRQAKNFNLIMKKRIKNAIMGGLNAERGRSEGVILLFTCLVFYVI